jgi:BirA family biotin operon repressor/biotin-[acetyl-CoA-carboxylase] ligase
MHNRYCNRGEAKKQALWYNICMKPLALYSPFNAPVFHAETVSSTMDVARDLTAQGAPHGTVITADFQEAGRGRIRQRTWNMEPCINLPFTILLRFSRIEDIPAALTLRTGLAAARAMEKFIPALSGRVLVKWPNDIMIRINDATVKKTAGILAEASGGTVFIGIGINVAQRQFPDSIQHRATSLSLASGEDIKSESRFVLLEKILACLHSEIESAAEKDWRIPLVERLYKKGERVSFMEGGADSGRMVEGILDGIGPGGELLITPDGSKKPRAFLAGELRLYSDEGAHP